MPRSKRSKRNYLIRGGSPRVEKFVPAGRNLVRFETDVEFNEKGNPSLIRMLYVYRTLHSEISEWRFRNGKWTSTVVSKTQLYHKWIRRIRPDGGGECTILKMETALNAFSADSYTERVEKFTMTMPQMLAYVNKMKGKTDAKC